MNLIMYMDESHDFTYLNVSCFESHHTYMDESHHTHMDESHHTYKCFMSQARDREREIVGASTIQQYMSHVTPMNESRHTCK